MPHARRTLLNHCTRIQPEGRGVLPSRVGSPPGTLSDSHLHHAPPQVVMGVHILAALASFFTKAKSFLSTVGPFVQTVGPYAQGGLTYLGLVKHADTLHQFLPHVETFATFTYVLQCTILLGLVYFHIWRAVRFNFRLRLQPRSHVAHALPSRRRGLFHFGRATGMW